MLSHDSRRATFDRIPAPAVRLDGRGVCLLIWLLRLLLSRRARSRFAARPVLGVVLMLVLALAASFYLSFQYQVWQIDREFARRDAARRVTLAQAQTLGGVLMPAGARLTLAKEGELETFTEALFDPPAPAFGLRVSRIERYLHTDYDSKTYEELRRYPHTIHLWGEGPQQVEGWLCDTSQKLRLRVEDEGTRPEFAECVLAEGNAIEGGVGRWPAGTELLRMGRRRLHGWAPRAGELDGSRARSAGTAAGGPDAGPAHGSAG